MFYWISNNLPSAVFNNHLLIVAILFQIALGFIVLNLISQITYYAKVCYSILNTFIQKSFRILYKLFRCVIYIVITMMLCIISSKCVEFGLYIGSKIFN